MTLLILMLLLNSLKVAHAAAILKGNLLFEEIGGYQLNQEYMTFSRKVDTSDLETFAQTLLSSAELYKQFCAEVEKIDEKTRTQTANKERVYTVPTSKVSFQNAPGACNKMRAILPELRSKQDVRDLEDVMTFHNIHETVAGIQYSQVGKVFRYLSDETPAKNSSLFPAIYYGGSYQDEWHPAKWELDTYLIKEAKSYPLTYRRTAEGMRLRVLDANKLGRQTSIICQVNPETDKEAVENSVLNQITNHNCKRDLPAIQTTTYNSLAEIKTITELDVQLSSNSSASMNNFLPQIRPKRDLASAGVLSVFGTIVGGTTYLLKSIIDTFVGASQYAKKSDLIKIAHEMDALKINQQELAKVNERISNSIQTLTAAIDDIYLGVTNMNMESEIKNLNRYLQFVLSTTILKYSQAFMAAKDNKLHPYALSTSELKFWASKAFTDHKIHLDTNPNNVRAAAIVYNSSIVFLFDIPIIQQDKHFNFYHITPVPTFDHNVTYIPDIDATNIAISRNGDKYTTLTAIELSKCIDTPPVCDSHRPVSPITNQALCVASSYITNSRKCPLKMSPGKPEPFLHFHQTKLIYSVPNNTTLYIKCYETGKMNVYLEDTVTISGMGHATYRPSCMINLPDGTTFKTPSDKIIHTINDWPIFNINSAIPGNVNTQLSFPNHTSNTLLTKHSEQTFSSIADTFDEFTYKDLYLGFITTVIPLLFMAAMIGIVYICKQRKKANELKAKVDDRQNQLRDPQNYWFIDDTPSQSRKFTVKDVHI